MKDAVSIFPDFPQNRTNEKRKLHYFYEWNGGKLPRLIRTTDGHWQSTIHNLLDKRN